MVFEMIDYACADALKTDVKTYVQKIEATTENRRYLIINAILSDNQDKIEKAKRIFNLITC